MIKQREQTMRYGNNKIIGHPILGYMTFWFRLIEHRDTFLEPFWSLRECQIHLEGVAVFGNDGSIRQTLMPVCCVTINTISRNLRYQTGREIFALGDFRLLVPNN